MIHCITSYLVDSKTVDPGGKIIHSKTTFLDLFLLFHQFLGEVQRFFSLLFFPFIFGVLFLFVSVSFYLIILIFIFYSLIGYFILLFSPRLSFLYFSNFLYFLFPCSLHLY